MNAYGHRAVSQVRCASDFNPAHLHMPNRVESSTMEPSSAAMLRRRAEAITWARTQIARYGLTYADLAAAGVFPSRRRMKQKVRYRSADGQTWDGEGDMPDWLQRAVNAGQNPEHFRVGD